MSNQEVKEGEIMSRDPEMPDVVMEEAEEGVDGEIDDEIQEVKAVDKGGSASRSGGRDTADESPRKSKSGSDRRRRHHHHHSGSGNGSGHHKRRRSGGHSEEEGEAVEDSGRSRRRSDSMGDDHAPISSTSSHRRNRDRRSSRSQRSRYRSDAPRDEWQQGGSVEEPLASSRSRRTEREKKVEAEAEDGEILEDGELDDDDDGNNDNKAVAHEESVNARLSLDTNIEDTEGSPTKPHNSSKEDGKSQKRDKKRQEHRDKRKREDNKKKRKKYVDMDKMPEDESEPAPAWGSGYQGGRPKSSPHRPSSRSPPHSKSSKNPGGRTKGYQSPPGLYDSPSYSEDSEDDQYPPPSLGLLSGGYLDASVAADEKEGVFKRGVTFKKKKRPDRGQSGMGKRRGQDFGKAEGPPKKKALIDIAMSDRPKCKFYRDGKCAKGSGCPFNHDMDQAKRMEVCKYHLTVKGCHKERCLYMHDFPCKYYHTGAQCFSGDRCKFSHDTLTQDTRRALEMRVAPEDILDMDEPDYESDYDYRQRNYESRPRPSLLGSPPRRHDVKKIPSLFDIEVHPPAPSPKPSPSSIRPSGFYNEAGSSPPSSGENMGNPRGVAMPNNGGSGNNNISNNNNSSGSMGNMVSGVGPVGANNQGGGPGLVRANMSGNMAGQGLLQTPNLHLGAGGGSMGPMMGGPMGGNRPPLMGNQPMRPGMPFMNNNSNNSTTNSNNGNNSNPPSNNLPPVLNMLGAIIREAAMQKVGSAASSMNMNGPTVNNMGGMNMGPNNMNNMPPNSMPNVQKNMPPNSMANVQNMNNMPPNSMPNAQNMNNMPPNSMPNVQNMNNMPPNSMANAQNMNNMPPNSMPNVQNMNNMPPNSMPNVQNMNNMPPISMSNVQNMNNNMPPNSMPNVVQNTMNNAMNMVQGNMNAMAQNSMNSMGPNNMNRMMQSMNQMGPNNMGPPGAGAMGTNHRGQINPSGANSNILLGRACDDNAMMPGDSASDGKNNAWEQEDMMDMDYRVKQNFDDGDETSKDLSELDLIRRRLQEQIKQEEGEEEGEEEEEEMEENPAEDQTTSQEDQPSKDKNGFSPDQQEAMDDCSTKGSLKAASDSTLDSIEVPAHLPKKQRELFMRIQQQHILREREKERQEALKSSEEADSNVEKDDWYSSSDEEEEDKAKTPEKSKDGIISESTSGASEGSSSTLAAAKPSFDIMQMINAIRSQVTTAAESKTSGPPDTACKPDPRRRVHSVETKAPASPPTSPVHQSPTPPSFPLPALAAEPPVISATPTKPLKYTIIKIALNMAKTYTFLPVNVDVTDPGYKFDPRVKRHLQLVEKHPRSPVSVPREKDVRRSSVDSTTTAADKSAKLVDPRLNRTPTDPRLSKMGGGSPSSGRPDEGRPTDPRLKKDSAPARPVDPRLAKRAASAINDPRLNRQISQESGNQVMGGQMNNMAAASNAGGNFMGNMHPRMGSPMGNMGGLMGNVGGGMNTMGGPMNNMGGPMNNMGGPRNNIGGPMNNIGGPMNSMGGLVNNQMGGVMNNMNGPVRPPMQGGGPMNNMNRMGGPLNSVGNSMNNMNNPLNNFGGPMNNMGGNRMPSSMGANSQGNMTGSHGPSLLGGPMNRMGGQSGVSNPMSNQMGGPSERTHASFLEKPNDPRLTQRSLSDPRLNDPRIQNKSQEMQDQGVNRNDPRIMSGGQIGRPANSGDSGQDPRLASGPRRSSDFSRSGPDESLASRSFPSPNVSDVSQERDSISCKLTKGILEPLPSLSSSASLPPLPSLSPPTSFSSTVASSSFKETQPSLKLSTSEVEKPTKKFDYRNDPRFKRVKRATTARQSSMEYSSPLGGDQGEMQNAEEPAGSLQYNSYNRPKPTGASSPHRQNAPSPTLPDTLQDFDTPDLPPPTDLKVKDVFKAIDPTASPFC